jgi:low molecular weight protein-tyrosine phosphatase
MMRLLFVCSGNICRSPLAEAIFASLLREKGLHDRFELDSAGTHGWHEGEPADPRARRVGESHDVPVTSIAREVRSADFERFDLILAMDRGHVHQLRRICPPAHFRKIRLMRDFDEPGSDPDVPDPYYGEYNGFEGLFQMLSVCCRNLLKSLLASF